MKRSSRPRKAANLSESLNRQLKMYTLAAGAVGLGMLASTQSAEGKIVYTPVQVIIEKPFPLDLNHDGIVDFYLLRFQSYSGDTRYLSACQFITNNSRSTFCTSSSKSTNQIRMIASMGFNFGAALHPGARIQHGDAFRPHLLLGRIFGYYSTSNHTDWYGPWFNGGKGVRNRYLGLKFKIKGRFHFGWARITITTSGKRFTATLTGYAYETIPGKGIVAGKRTDSDVATFSPASLGHLAAGASAIPAWRLKHTAATIH